MLVGLPPPIRPHSHDSRGRFRCLCGWDRVVTVPSTHIEPEAELVDWEVILQIVVVLGGITLGVRTGGLGLGLWGIAATGVLVFVFGLDPGSAPIGAIGIIFAVITASAAMEAAGGIDFLVDLAGRMIKAHPSRITFAAPLVSLAFTIFAGTSNIFFALIPVIYATSFENGIRPERPLAAATVASALGITASPVSAAMAAYTGLLPEGFGLVQVLAITVPASIVACLVIALVSSRLGKPLEEDPVYRSRVEAGEVGVPQAVAERDPELAAIAARARADRQAESGSVDVAVEEDTAELAPGAKKSAVVFGVAVLIIMVFGLFEGLRPVVGQGDDAGPLSMTFIIQVIMFTAALVMIMWLQVKPGAIVKQSLMNAGLVAAIALLGIALMVDTFLAGNQELIIDPLAGVVESLPLMLAVALFLLAGFTTSQSAVTLAIVPFGLAALSPAVVTAMWPSLIGVWLFPANGQQIAAVELDRTGSTTFSKLPVWHSFTVPMLVGWVAVVATGLLIAPFVG